MLQHIASIDADMLKHNLRQIAKTLRVEDVGTNRSSLGRGGRRERT